MDIRAEIARIRHAPQDACHLAVDDKHALVAVHDLGNEALDDQRLAADLGHQFADDIVEVRGIGRRLEDARSTAKKERLDHDLLEATGERAHLGWRTANEGLRHEPPEFQRSEFF